MEVGLRPSQGLLTPFSRCPARGHARSATSVATWRHMRCQDQVGGRV